MTKYIQWLSQKSILSGGMENLQDHPYTQKKTNKQTRLMHAYRPLCINSIFGKILEKLLNNRIYHFLHVNILLNPLQYGFTHGTSATKALYDLKQQIINAKERNVKSILISFDISNTFKAEWVPFVLVEFKDNTCLHTSSDSFRKYY